MNIKTDPYLRNNPVVRLVDCLKYRKYEEPTKLKNEMSRDVMDFLDDGILTPVSDQSSVGEEAVDKQKIEYEIEEIAGYHRGEDNVMWYYVKWKNFSKKYNTWELMENLTNCNRLLMSYFEFTKPSQEIIAKMDKEIEESLPKCKLYNELIKSNFKREKLLKFPKCGILNISRILFGKKSKFRQRNLKKEYTYIVRCLIGMYFHRDPELFKRAQYFKIALKLCDMREKQLERLKIQELEINKLELYSVRVINYKDLEVLPDDVEYITESRAGVGITIPTDPIWGCSCIGGCSSRTLCCGKFNDSVFAYRKGKTVKNMSHWPIYECNWRCSCSLDCPNRVVQHGRKCKVAIFKTENRGWGLMSMESIKQGTFVCEYIGELISESESVVRDVEYFPKNLLYMFNLDYSLNKEEAPYSIDATRCGNLARYINHSCDPNMETYPVWINCMDPHMPRLAFFTKRHIKKGEELTIDYLNTTESERKEDKGGVKTLARQRCLCRSSNCREWL